MGLTFAVLASGGRRVISTLWAASDVATSEMMRVLYTGIFNDGLLEAQALRKAQLELIGSKRWSHPKYWATFVLIG
jgi:CHAT domain-containing protein